MSGRVRLGTTLRTLSRYFRDSRPLQRSEPKRVEINPQCV